MGIEDNLVGKWSATLSQSWSDLSASNDLTPVNNAAIVADTDSGGSDAFDFPAETDYANTVGNVLADANAASSTSCWVKFSSFVRNAGLLSIANSLTASALAYMFYLEDRDGGGVRHRARGNNTSTYVVALNTWHHLCYSCDGQGLDSRFYVNGTLAETIIRSSASTHRQLFLTGGQTVSAAARLDTIRVYDRAINQTEITELFTIGRAESGGPPAAAPPHPLSGKRHPLGAYTGQRDTFHPLEQ